MMRPLRLVQVAAEAEALRLNRRVRRAMLRAVLGFVALLLLLGAIAFLHVAAWFWLIESLPPRQVGLVFAGVDLALAAILGTVAACKGPGRIEREALALRRRALDEAGEAVALARLLPRLLPLLMRWLLRR